MLRHVVGLVKWKPSTGCFLRSRQLYHTSSGPNYEVSKGNTTGESRQDPKHEFQQTGNKPQKKIIHEYAMSWCEPEQKIRQNFIARNPPQQKMEPENPMAIDSEEVHPEDKLRGRFWFQPGESREIETLMAGSEECDWSQVRQKYGRDLSTVWTNRVLLALRFHKDMSEALKQTKAISLMEYIRKEQTGELTATNIVLLMLVLTENKFQCEHENLVISLYEELMTKTDVLDGIMGFCVIKCLSRTHRWRECLDVQNLIYDVGGKANQAVIAQGAFHFGDYELGLELLGKLWPHDIEPNRINKTLLEMFQDDRVAQSEKAVRHILDFIQQQDVFPSEKLADAMVEWLCRDGAYTPTKAHFSNDCVCSHCGKEVVKEEELTMEEFEEIRDVYKEDVFIANDVFRNTTAQEFEKFKNFIETVPRPDIVLDVLNIRHLYRRSKTQLAPGLVSNEMVFAIAEHYQKQGLQVMIIGRKFLHKSAAWKILTNRLGNVRCFYVSNISRDDPFMVYAAMHSGPQARIVTRDELRNHMQLMGKVGGQRIRQNFIKWQRTRQCYPLYGNLDTNKVKILEPRKFAVRLQEDAAGNWHIPFCNAKEIRPSFLRGNSWICLTRNEEGPRTPSSL